MNGNKLHDNIRHSNKHNTSKNTIGYFPNEQKQAERYHWKKKVDSSIQVIDVGLI